jgi:AcrR family transcriptional regulator
MPKVTPAYRQARRDEIASAALRCLRRNGVRNTSIADVVAESGLSAGAIYSHFRNKAELAAYIAGSFMTWRIEEFEAAEHPDLAHPTGAMRFMLGVFDDGDVAPEVLLQFWGEATTDPELRAVMTGVIGRMRTAFGHAIRPWAEQRAGATGAQALAERTASVMIAICQGYIANAALFGPRPADDYLADAAAAFA